MTVVATTSASLSSDDEVAEAATDVLETTNLDGVVVDLELDLEVLVWVELFLVEDVLELLVFEALLVVVVSEEPPSSLTKASLYELVSDTVQSKIR